MARMLTAGGVKYVFGIPGTNSKDLWKEPLAKVELPPQERFMPSAKLAPNPRLVDEAARMLVEAEQPLLLAGDETTKYGGRREKFSVARMR